jgi:hypothetical protein
MNPSFSLFEQNQEFLYQKIAADERAASLDLRKALLPRENAARGRMSLLPRRAQLEIWDMVSHALGNAV